MAGDTAAIVLDHVQACLGGSVKRPFVVGICGAQGSGKSWLVAKMETQLAQLGYRACPVSIDDFYLPKTARNVLARQVHPLFAVRGVPGTHDVALAMATLDALGQSGQAEIPAFDKANDDCLPLSRWKVTPAPVDVVLFEGWCVGAIAQAEAELVQPVNMLEASEDPDGSWRTHVNAALAGPYQDLFAMIDTLVLLEAPGFEIVTRWRTEQEATLRTALAARGQPTDRLMDNAAIARFVSHYERLTRHILAEMPARADLVVQLDENRQPRGIRARSG